MSTSVSADDEESDYEAEFTSEQTGAVVICNRPGCSREFPPGTKLRLMHNKHGGPDRFFCSNCFEHYRNKGTTVRRTTRTPGTSYQGIYKFYCLPVLFLLLKKQLTLLAHLHLHLGHPLRLLAYQDLLLKAALKISQWSVIKLRQHSELVPTLKFFYQPDTNFLL
jgi:hypothetical protein